jgi:hypothetical protein
VLSASEGKSSVLLLVMPICRRKFVSRVTVRAGANLLDLRSPLLDDVAFSIGSQGLGMLGRSGCLRARS